MNYSSERKCKILIIDDNRGISFVMKKALELKNYEVTAIDALKNLNLIEKINPDLILLDISLKETDGRDISKLLKDTPSTKYIPIIIVTAHSNASALAKEARADGYVSKPFDLENLFKTVENHIQ